MCTETEQSEEEVTMSNIAVLLAGDFEDSEFAIPRERLRQAGHTVTVLAKHKGQPLTGKRRDVTVEADDAIAQRSPDEFDALLVPGGYSPDRLRLEEAAVDFVRRFATSDKPMAVICHGAQLLIEAEVVAGREMTSWPSVRKDLINAGAKWVDREVVIDGNLITSRKPQDLDAFCGALLEHLPSA